jgi:hypothetical protein
MEDVGAVTSLVVAVGQNVPLALDLIDIPFKVIASSAFGDYRGDNLLNGSTDTQWISES